MAKEETGSEVSAIASRFNKMTVDELFDKFYNALPKGSPRFHELHDEIQAMAASCLTQDETKGKRNEIQL